MKYMYGYIFMGVFQMCFAVRCVVVISSYLTPAYVREGSRAVVKLREVE